MTIGQIASAGAYVAVAALISLGLAGAAKSWGDAYEAGVQRKAEAKAAEKARKLAEAEAAAEVDVFAEPPIARPRSPEEDPGSEHYVRPTPITLGAAAPAAPATPAEEESHYDDDYHE